MGLLDFFKGSAINSEVDNYKHTPQAVLLDVRNADEYKDGHIPGSISVPVNEIQDIEEVIKDKKTPVFVYCFSGRRAGKAVQIMKTFGYENVKNIGGIKYYKGLTVR